MKGIGYSNMEQHTKSLTSNFTEVLQNDPDDLVKALIRNRSRFWKS